MNRKIIFVLFIILTVFIIIYIENGINSYDLKFYHGKDNGAFVEFESICILSAIFFLIMSKKNKIINCIIGFILGIIIGIFSYLMLANFGIFGLAFNVVGCLLFIIVFFVLEKWKVKTEKK